MSSQNRQFWPPSPLLVVFSLSKIGNFWPPPPLRRHSLWTAPYNISPKWFHRPIKDCFFLRLKNEKCWAIKDKWIKHLTCYFFKVWLFWKKVTTFRINLKIDNHSNCIKIKTRQNKELKNCRKNIPDLTRPSRKMTALSYSWTILMHQNRENGNVSTMRITEKVKIRHEAKLPQ